MRLIVGHVSPSFTNRLQPRRQANALSTQCNDLFFDRPGAERGGIELAARSKSALLIRFAINKVIWHSGVHACV